MLIGFKKQFVSKIEDGSKTHTIRSRRKDGQVAKPGERLYLYQGLRTKGCRMIGVARCIDTYDILIDARAVYLSGIRLHKDELDCFAIQDGFESFEHFMRYWSRTQELPFTGVLTRWECFVRNPIQ